MNKFALAFVAALMIAACATQQDPGAITATVTPATQVNAPQNPAQGVFAAKASLLAALTVVADYRKLPACGPDLILCRDTAVEKRLQALSNGAASALDDAEKAVRTPGVGVDQLATLEASATLAIKALTTITDTLRTR